MRRSRFKAWDSWRRMTPLQLRAREIGQRVLDNWPVPLQGYKYRFSVMEDDEVNAYALPTGLIFVNRGLIDAAESDLEIEA